MRQFVSELFRILAQVRTSWLAFGVIDISTEEVVRPIGLVKSMEVLDWLVVEWLITVITTSTSIVILGRVSIAIIVTITDSIVAIGDSIAIIMPG